LALGRHWYALTGVFHRFALLLLVLFVVAIGIWIWSHLRSGAQRAAAKQADPTNL
jgi:hypothetical protein